MRTLTLCLLAVALLALPLVAAESIHPYPLYPFEPVPGYPGFGTPEIQPKYEAWLAAKKAGDEAAMAAALEGLSSSHFFPGHPQFLPYEGSVENARAVWQRYVPPYPLYNHNTLVKNVVLRDYAPTAEACVPFAEPVYWFSQWNKRVPTSKRRDVGRVYPWKPGASITLTAGPLPERTMGIVRIIGAMKVEDVVSAPTVALEKPTRRAAKQFVFKYEINDRPDGGVSTYVLRARPWDQMYDVGSCLWHVLDDREFTLTMTLLPESEGTLYVHNIDVHDAFGEMAQRAGKAGPVTYDPAERAKAWAANRAALAEQNRRKSGTLRREVSDYHRGLRGEDPSEVEALLAAIDGPGLNAEDRAKRDRNLWHSLPPLNHQIDRRAASQAEGLKAGWQPAGKRMSDWAAPWRFVRNRGAAAEVYTWHDMAAYKPLPGTEDRGWGVMLDEPLKGRGPRQVLSYMALLHMERWRNQGRRLSSLVELYDKLGDRHAARDAAFLFARMLYHYPALRGVNYLTWAELKNPIWRGDDGRGGRYDPAHWGSMSLDRMVPLYDQLFPFIDGNEELARALGEHIPWIETPDDVRHLFDVYLVQYTARDHMHFRRVTGHGTPGGICAAAAVQDSPDISRPWMEFLFSRSWEYPQALAGIDDNVVTSTTREGVTNIGSYAYTGPVGLRMAEKTRMVVEAGGDPKFDLGNFRRYAKSAAAPSFAAEARVGGGFYPGIGDVGGPARPHDYQMAKVVMLSRHGWELTQDAASAWILTRHTKADEYAADEWAAMQKAAATLDVSPLLSQKSRVLSDWFGALESGVGHPDFRFHRAVAVNVGNGIGHAHDDTLDLRIWALGANMSGDFGQRQSYGRPRHNATFSHNLVEVDGDGAYWTQNTGEWDGYAWIRGLFDAPGAPVLLAESIAPPRHPNVSLMQRQVALIDVDEGTPSQMTPPEQDPDVVLPRSFVFDVVRVAGGKRHTYCFHGSVDDNLLEEGGFEINVKDREIVEEASNEALENGTATREQRYLRNFRWARVCERFTGKKPSDLDKEWAADPAADTLQATWRMGERAYQHSVGGENAATAPRKYMRMHLFNVGDHRVMHGINTDTNGGNPLNPGIKHYSGRCIYVQKDHAAESDAVYVALLEPYEGTPTIVERRALAVEGAGDDARRPVAVEVKTAGGQRHVLFADGAPDQPERTEGLTAQAQFASLAYDGDELQRATLSGGRSLKTDGLAVAAQTDRLSGTITSLDLLDRVAVVEGLPADPRLAGQFFEVGNDLHKTSFQIDRIEATPDGHARVHFRKGLEIMRGTILKADYANNQLVTNIAMLHYPGRDDGLVATNQEDLDRRWRVRYEGGSRFDGHTFTLKGDPITEADFPVGGKLSVWEFGVGDTLSLTTGVSLRRVDDGVWEVYATTAFTLDGPAPTAWSADGETWQALKPGGPLGTPDMPLRFYLRSE